MGTDTMMQKSPDLAMDLVQEMREKVWSRVAHLPTKAAVAELIRMSQETVYGCPHEVECVDPMDTDSFLDIPAQEHAQNPLR